MSTRDRLIESTRQLLWERGYVGTSPKAIQAHADAGQGSMYHHFSGKQELARAAIERSAEEMTEVAERQLSSAQPPVERVIGWLCRERDALMGCRLGGLAQDPDIVASEELRSPIAEHFAWLRGRLQDVLAEAGLDVHLADTLMAVLQGGYVLARAANSQQPFTDAVEGAVTLVRAAAAAR